MSCCIFGMHEPGVGRFKVGHMDFGRCHVLTAMPTKYFELSSVALTEVSTYVLDDISLRTWASRYRLFGLSNRSNRCESMTYIYNLKFLQASSVV